MSRQKAESFVVGDVVYYKGTIEVYLIDDKKVVHTVASQLELVYTV